MTYEVWVEAMFEAWRNDNNLATYELQQLKDCGAVSEPIILIDDLSLRNRAYQVLYALGDTSSTVRTLTSGEAQCLVGIVQDLPLQLTTGIPTDLDLFLYQHMSSGMIAYVAGGRIG